ncbi:MAG: hypothetical protein ACRCVZ_09980, partial [Aestuariivirga sp.]
MPLARRTAIIVAPPSTAVPAPAIAPRWTIAHFATFGLGRARVCILRIVTAGLGCVRRNFIAIAIGEHGLLAKPRSFVAFHPVAAMIVTLAGAVAATAAASTPSTPAAAALAIRRTARSILV